MAQPRTVVHGVGALDRAGELLDDVVLLVRQLGRRDGGERFAVVLRELRGENSIYHNNCIQTWYVNAEGIAENVEVS